MNTSPPLATWLVYPGSIEKDRDEIYGYFEQSITIPMRDGTKLHGCFFYRGASAPLVCVYCGNGMNAGDMIFMATVDTSRSWLFMNYRGFGSSQGEPSEKQIVEDACFSIRYVRSLVEGAVGPLFLIGFSLGSAVATQVAVVERPEHLTLICPMDCFHSVIGHRIPSPDFRYDTWRSIDYAPFVSCPVSIMYGKYDTIVPPAATLRLASAFPNLPHIRSYPSGHNDIFRQRHIMSHIYAVMERSES